ncbi:collagen alpha-2(I) chain-like [Lutra lutra]|uniref:collagen alpha-2(I) chain-like n=1 Tax=Lutra lutra TaxID=9657 RepID=UPI001FD374A3|nr:collagen alpha-2(I) chain-like [Lutra lutra]
MGKNKSPPSSAGPTAHPEDSAGEVRAGALRPRSPPAPGVQAPGVRYQPPGTHSAELGRLFSCCSIRIRKQGREGLGGGLAAPLSRPFPGIGMVPGQAPWKAAPQEQQRAGLPSVKRRPPAGPGHSAQPRGGQLVNKDQSPLPLPVAQAGGDLDAWTLVWDSRSPQGRPHRLGGLCVGRAHGMSKADTEPGQAVAPWPGTPLTKAIPAPAAGLTWDQPWKAGTTQTWTLRQPAAPGSWATHILLTVL